jgi:hypothetical protein
MSTAIIVAELLLKYGPDVAETFQRWFSGQQPRPDDWARLFALARKTPDEYRREAEAELDRKP